MVQVNLEVGESFDVSGVKETDPLRIVAIEGPGDQKILKALMKSC